MTVMKKRTTVYLEQELHQALRLKAVVMDRSLSQLINEMIREHLSEDADDLRAFRDRADEPVVDYESLLEDLRTHGKL